MHSPPACFDRQLSVVIGIQFEGSEPDERDKDICMPLEVTELESPEVDTSKKFEKEEQSK